MNFSKIIKFSIRFFGINLFFGLLFYIPFYKDMLSATLSLNFWIASFFPVFFTTIFLVFKLQLKEKLKLQWKSLSRINLKDLLIVIGIGLLLPLTVVIIHAYVFKVIEFHFKMNAFMNLKIILSFMPLIFLSASLEELGFRFILFEETGKKIEYKNLFIISLVFGFFHMFNPHFSFIGITNVVLSGVLLSIVYLKTNNLLYSSIVHFLWNYVLGCIFNSHVSGMNFNGICDYKTNGNVLFNGGNFGLEGSVITTLIMSVFILVLFHSSVFKSALLHQKNNEN